jgi:hypothetical protein
MKKLIYTVALILSCTGLVSCGDAQNPTNTATPSPISATPTPETTTASSPVPTAETTTASSPAATEEPQTGTVKELVSGDISCYVTLVDEAGKEHNLGATFEICEQKDIINKKVQLSYSIEKVNDCESAEPCGKTREESLISKAEVVGGN